jgi:HK97 family phage major capsid protein
MATATGKQTWNRNGHQPASSSKGGFGEFVQAIAQKDFRTFEKFWSPQEKAAMNEGSGLQGGYIVPLDYSNQFYRSLAEHSILWPRASIELMNSLEKDCPIVDCTTTQTAGTTPFFGGIVFTWGEGGKAASPVIPETEPTSRKLTLRANSLIGQLIASNQLLWDITPDGEQKLIDLFGEAAAWYADNAFFNGLGAANEQPAGILNAPAVIHVPRASANQITYKDFATMAGSMFPSGFSKAIWCVSPSALVSLVQINGFIPNQDPYSSLDGSCGSLLCRPVYVTEKLPALGTTGDFIFIDPSLYVIGDRQQVRIDVSPHPLFRTNQSVFRVWLRVDGRPMLSNSVTLADGTTESSGFVVLQ